MNTDNIVPSFDVDELTARLTAFDSFADLVGTHPNYRPTILPRDEDHVRLADAYDAHMESEGDPRRAWRGTGAARQTEQGDSIVLSVRLSSICPHGKLSNTCCGYPEWLQVVHAINRDFQAREKGELYIGTPLRSHDWWAGGWAEEYPAFRIILISDQHTNYIQAKTATAAEYLRRAVQAVTGRVVDDQGQTIRIVTKESAS